MTAPFDIAAHTVFLALGGSHAHGTAREGSDLDLRGVCVVPLSVRVSPSNTFEQYEGLLEGELRSRVATHLAARPGCARAIDRKAEAVVYDVAKFVTLCANANPSALEILCTDPRDWLIHEPAWDVIHRERARFLTRRVQQTFLAYALAQLARIEMHRVWLRSPPSRKPSRADFGLPQTTTLSRDDQDRVEAAIEDRLRRYGIDRASLTPELRATIAGHMDALLADLMSVPVEDMRPGARELAARALGLPAEVRETIGAERRYRGAMRQWESYEAWRTNRNPARAELERRFGYDTKHAAHLVRMMRMGLEVLECGDLRVRRPDAAELLAIRDGALSYEALRELAATLEQRMKSAAEASSLPPEVDPDLADELVRTIVLPRG